MKISPGPRPDQHVLCPPRPVLDARVGRSAAVKRDGGHEPVDGGRAVPGHSQQEEEEGVGGAKPKEDVRRGNLT